MNQSRIGGIGDQIRTGRLRIAWIIVPSVPIRIWIGLGLAWIGSGWTQIGLNLKINKTDPD
jgi:hypothetical protein